jgi:hypothetical protein
MATKVKKFNWCLYSTIQQKKDLDVMLRRENFDIYDFSFSLIPRTRRKQMIHRDERVE